MNDYIVRIVKTWLTLLVPMSKLDKERVKKAARLNIKPFEYVLIWFLPFFILVAVVLSVDGVYLRESRSYFVYIEMLAAYVVGTLLSAIYCVIRGKGIHR